jgi:hypothetical protein
MLSEEILDDFDVSIDPQVILLVHGYGAEKKPRQTIVDMVSRVAEEAGKLIRPRAIYREFPVARSDTESITLENGIQLSVGRKISSLWQGSRALGMALCTLGTELEDRVSALLEEGEQMQALNLDIAGTIALGLVGYQVQNMACGRLSAEGVEAGPWLNPGYIDWPLTDQRLIFSMLPAESIGVALNDSCMMIPRKSVTVSAGIGVSGSGAGFNRCRHCGIAKCQFRRLTVSPGSDAIQGHDC